MVQISDSLCRQLHAVWTQGFAVTQPTKIYRSMGESCRVVITIHPSYPLSYKFYLKGNPVIQLNYFNYSPYLDFVPTPPPQKKMLERPCTVVILIKFLQKSFMFYGKLLLFVVVLYDYNKL